MQGETPTTAGEPPVLRRALSLAADHANGGRSAEAEFLYEQVLDAAHGQAEAREALAELQRPSFARRAARRAARTSLHALTQRPRILRYKLLSTCTRVQGGKPVILQPVLFLGSGAVVLGEHVQFGWKASPLFYTGYCHVEAAHPDAVIEFGDRVEFNNNAFLKSEGAGIRIGRDSLFGAHVEIFDSNFHDLDPRKRVGGTPKMAPVDIGENTFIGMGVKILKGVTVGADTVIGAGAVVASSVPSGVIVAGNPARVVREL